MIVNEGLPVLRDKKLLLRLTAEDLFDRRDFCAFHLKKEGDALVVAEGEETVGNMAYGTSLLSAVEGHVYSHDPDLKRLYEVNKNRVYMNATDPHNILYFYKTDGTKEMICVTTARVMRLEYDSNSSYTYTTKVGGSYAAVLHERLFIADGIRIYYSMPLSVQNWNEARYGAGYLDLCDDLGEICGMLSYRDKLVISRTHGITILRALADDVNFKAVPIPLICGKTVKNSAAFCGDNVGYFTDRGFFLFNGAKSVAAEHSLFDEIDISAPVKAVSRGGRYYALITKKSGDNAIYCYDPLAQAAHFIENGATSIASGDELYFSRAGVVYSLTEKGISLNRVPYFTAKNIGFSMTGEKTLRAVSVEGEGKFGLTVSSGRGSRTLKGSANEIIKLRSPLRGNGFDIKIDVNAEDTQAMRFCAVTLRFTEESDDD